MRVSSTSTAPQDIQRPIGVLVAHKEVGGLERGGVEVVDPLVVKELREPIHQPMSICHKGRTSKTNMLNRLTVCV